MEWFDELSLWWYATGTVFIGTLYIVTTVWLFFELYRVLVGDEDDPERHSHKSE